MSTHIREINSRKKIQEVCRRTLLPTQPCIKDILCFVPDAFLGRLHIVAAISHFMTLIGLHFCSADLRMLWKGMPERSEWEDFIGV